MDQISSLNDCSSTSLGSYEDCYAYSWTSDTTTLYVAVHAYEGYSDLMITCTQEEGPDYADYWGLNQTGNSTDSGSQSYCANKIGTIVSAVIVGVWMLFMM